MSDFLSITIYIGFHSDIYVVIKPNRLKANSKKMLTN